ncbi:putative mitochondrial hypothetical protein [Leptomonas pyrrhocoris]|uniref:START domain-containing protein n=1 Tax=Leptomonas pyrrhocoris TaxID=157538 RepID=A0A0M9G291_LEPPY|nr:putative mitochondrial hypothetical protein [Leptomonas pyrrhocoris]XP_015659166.1 putative mitochondrial hypothetical protein [Leptomonas pyrrhocoris]KPA80726.1 putative mitochondrial hypothetical protein [Leptomonas pyrrhocoris]KPA80727.1 putative mitochondrial hypothetical protein [Leptomonas pyrrhocoris]|eukprot:XP_015659165.1 putative mitochondrial hypothetical protein [Leptomonas pyrrhocoris]
MSVLSVFLKAAALGAAMNALLPSRRAQCAPFVDAPPASAADVATQDLVASMRLLDQDPQWSIEADDFHNSLRAATVQLRLLRLSATYTDAEGDTAPVMRLVGLFPGVSTDTLYHYLTGLQTRPAWDANYTFYERFNGACRGTLQHPSLQRPMAAVAKKRPHCEGDVCTLVPDISSSIVDHDWFCHGVGSPSLRRFGLVDRLFQYERLTTVFRFAADAEAVPAGALAVYDILFSGSRRARDRAAADSPALAAWLQTKRRCDDVEGVDVNFQQITLIPIADAHDQLLARPEQLHWLCTMGSVMDDKAAKLVYNVFKDTQTRSEQGKASLPGSLLVMTSANNVHVPKLFPLWMQKKISGAVSRKAYGQLMAACVKDQGR